MAWPGYASSGASSADVCDIISGMLFSLKFGDIHVGDEMEALRQAFQGPLQEAAAARPLGGDLPCRPPHLTRQRG